MRNFPTLVALFTAFALTTAAQPAHPLAIVPFVGCPADGQQGPVPPPKGQSKHLPIPQSAANHLAWYQFNFDKSTPELAILAPRGWHCFGTYGSSGSTIYVAPESVNADQVIFQKNWHGFTGPAIELSLSFGGTSGRFQVAHIAARVLPHYRAFVKKIIAEGFEPASDLHFGPFPADKLTCKSDHLVEFTTPSNAVGLGTQSFLLQGPGEITGFAYIGGEDTDLVQLSMRLPPRLTTLAPAIIHQAEPASH